MPAVTLPAYFDGHHIVLDEPYALAPNTRLAVVVLPEEDTEREDWYRYGAQNLARAYGDDEPEYTMADIKKLNPDYRGPRICTQPRSGSRFRAPRN